MGNKSYELPSEKDEKEQEGRRSFKAFQPYKLKENQKPTYFLGSKMGKPVDPEPHEWNCFHPKNAKNGRVLVDSNQHIDHDNQGCCHKCITNHVSILICPHSCVVIWTFLSMPLVVLRVLVMFLLAVICAFFVGMYLGVKKTFEEWDCQIAVLVIPISMIVGGITGVFFPFDFLFPIVNIHRSFWLNFLKAYCDELATICCGPRHRLQECFCCCCC